MPEGGTGTFTQNPSVTFLVSLAQQVSNYVGGPSDTEVAAIAKEGIWDAIRRLNTHNWSWARVRTDTSFTASQQEYALSGNVKEMRAIELLNSSAAVAGSLVYLDAKTFDEKLPYRTQATGNPSYLTVFNEFDNGLLTLDVPPSAGFVAQYPTLRLRYYRRIPLPTGDSSIAEIPSDVEPFVKWHARMVAAAHWDPTKLALAERMTERCFADIQRANNMYGIAAWKPGL